MIYTEPHFTSSALIMVDIQNDFTLAGAPSQIEGTLAILPRVRALLQAYRTAGMPIVHIVRLYRPDGSNVDLCRRHLIEAGRRIVAPGSTGSQLVEALRHRTMPDLDAEMLLRGGIQAVGANEVVIYKPRWGAFYDTPLDDHLRRQAIDTLVVCGCNFPSCPRATIYEASERDFRLVAVADGISQLDQRGRRELAAIGVHWMRSQEILANLAGEREGQGKTFAR